MASLHLYVLWVFICWLRTRWSIWDIKKTAASTTQLTVIPAGTKFRFPLKVFIVQWSKGWNHTYWPFWFPLASRVNTACGNHIADNYWVTLRSTNTQRPRHPTNKQQKVPLNFSSLMLGNTLWPLENLSLMFPHFGWLVSFKKRILLKSIKCSVAQFDTICNVW